MDEGSSESIQMQILGPVDTVIPAGQSVQFLCQAVVNILQLLWNNHCGSKSSHFKLKLEIILNKTSPLTTGRSRGDQHQGAAHPPVGQGERGSAPWPLPG